MTPKPPCSPGSHPHSDRPNWQSAETVEDYQRNCDEGLEVYSDRRMAKLIGVSRTAVWRWQLMAQIPEDLFERLMANGVRSTKALAAVGRALRSGNLLAGEVETCPHCGGVLRVRPHISRATMKIVADWLAEQETPAERLAGQAVVDEGLKVFSRETLNTK